MRRKAQEAIKELSKEYQMSTLGELKWFLGIHVLRDRRQRLLWLFQEAYIKKTANQYEIDLKRASSRHSHGRIGTPPYRSLIDPSDASVPRYRPTSPSYIPTKRSSFYDAMSEYSSTCMARGVEQSTMEEIRKERTGKGETKE